VGGILQRTVRAGVLKRFARAMQAGLFAIRRLGSGVFAVDNEQSYSRLFSRLFSDDSPQK
jgi:hypothetical protein